MPQPNKYKHYLRYWDGSQWKYYIVSAGVVTETTTKTAIDRAPEGWQEYEISWERGWTYYGVFTNYTTPLRFIKDGAKILRHIAYTYGVEGNGVRFLIEKQDVTDWSFDTFFEGELDMSKAQDEFDSFIVPVIQGGFYEKLRSMEGTNYVYDLDGNPDARWLKHDGIEMQALIKWSMSSQVIDGYYQPTLPYYDTEGTQPYLHPISQDMTGTSNKFLENTSGQSLDITFRLNFSITIDLDAGVSAASQLKIQIREVVKSTNTLSTVHDYYTGSLFTPGTTQNHLDDVTLALTVPDDRYLTMTFRVWNPTASAFLLSGTDYNITAERLHLSAYYVYRFESSFIPTLPIKTVIEYLLADINDAAINVTDTLTDVFLNDQVVLTSGDGVRFLEGAKLTVNFADVFKFLNTHFGASLYYVESSNTVYIGQKEDVFEDAVNPDLTIGEVSEFTAKPHTDLMFTNLKIGGQKHDYDSKSTDDNEITNGKDEFNTLVERLSPLTRFNGKTEDYTSNIRTDMYGIELVRVNLGGKELADASSDNEVFAMHLESASTGTEDIIVGGVLTTVTYWELFRTAINLTPGASYFEIENIFSPETAYNIIFSPLRALLYNGSWFRSIFKFNDASSLRFQISGKNSPNNTKMIVSEGAVPTVYNEGANVTISSLCANDAVIFQPVVYKFKTKEEININEILATYPYRYINFTYNDISLNGYIIRITSQPTWRGSTEFELLAHRDDDLTDLIL